MQNPERAFKAMIWIACCYATVALLFFFYGCARPPLPIAIPVPYPPGPVLEKVNALTGDVDRGLDGKKIPLLAKAPRFPTVYFEYDQAGLSPAAAEALAASAKGLRAKWVCYVDGHASPEGTDDYNLALGARRASTVGAYLQAFKGITVVEASYGEEKPVAGPAALSRRVEVRCR